MTWLVFLPSFIYCEGESDNKRCLLPPSCLCNSQVGDLRHYGSQLGAFENPPPGSPALYDCLLRHLPDRSRCGDGHQGGDQFAQVEVKVVQAGEDHGSDTLVVFQGLATGSLLYVVFFEIMEKERKRAVSGLLQVRCVRSHGEGALSTNCPLFCGRIARTWSQLGPT